MLPISLSHLWYQSWVLHWVPNDANVFGFLLGWLLGLLSVFSLRVDTYDVSGLSLSHLLPYVIPLPVLCWLFAYGLCTYVHVRALVYLYLLCTGGTFHFLYLVMFSTVCFGLPSAYVSGLRLRTQIT